MKSEDIYTADYINTDGNHIHKTAIINSGVKLGKGNWIGAYSVIGSNGEIRGVKQTDFKGVVEIGDNNIISEHVTIQRPYEEGSVTKVGNNNIIMAHAHIGHDAVIEDNCEICCTSVIAGHTTVKEGAKIKLGVITRNRITIGEHSIVGMGSVVTKDVPERQVWVGNPAKWIGSAK
jgi:UDP-N-acetylglucosamine acyltransferase